MGLPLKSITVFENILLFSSAPFSIDMASLNEEEEKIMAMTEMNWYFPI